MTGVPGAMSGWLRLPSRLTRSPRRWAIGCTLTSSDGVLAPRPDYLEDFMREFSKFYFGHPSQFESLYYDQELDARLDRSRRSDGKRGRKADGRPDSRPDSRDSRPDSDGPPDAPNAPRVVERRHVVVVDDNGKTTEWDDGSVPPPPAPPAPPPPPPPPQD